MTDVFDADVLDLALETVRLMHRTDWLVREIFISLASLAVMLFRRDDGCHSGT